MHSTSETMGANSVPAFLTKIWTLVEDPSTDELIAWDASGLSFHVFDQARFAKEILPLYFKHSNIASFIRQLNMYGFRKVVHVDSGSIKCEIDDVEFQHPYFVQGRDSLLEHIKRKTSGTGVSVKTESGLKLNPEDVTRVLTDVQIMKGRQDTISSKMDKMKNENEALWREVANLRQKHMKQQQIVNKLIQFMIHLVGGKRGLNSGGLQKRKMPLMINDSGQVSPSKRPCYAKQLSIEELEDQQYVVKSPSEIVDTSLSATSGPVIQEVIDSMPTITSKAVIQNFSNLSTPTATYDKPPTIKQSSSLKLPTNVAAARYTDKMFDGLDISLDSSDLNSLVDSNLPTVTEPLSASVLNDSGSGNALEKFMRDNPIQDRIGSTPKLNLPTDMNIQLDTMQDEIDSLKDLLSGGQYNFDSSMVMNLFNGENPVPISVENLLGEVDLPQNSHLSAASTSSTIDPNTITGNELVQFHPVEIPFPIVPDLTDYLNDDGSLNTPELPDMGGVSEVDPMSFINAPVKVKEEEEAIIEIPGLEVLD